ncbi:MAG: thiol-disulfide oxidoreductase DCC family protein [Actinomycetales bacterium]
MRGLVPLGTRPTGQATGLVVFDGDCAFCTRSVDWARRWIRPQVGFIPWQRADLGALGLTVEDCSAALQFVNSAGVVHAGGRAVCAMLEAGRVPWPLVGRLASLPGVRAVVDAVYRLVARHRHRLPGASAACALQA